MELEQMQAEMNMLFGELLLADDSRQVVILMLLADLCKGMNQRAGLRIQNLTNAVGETITTAPKPEADGTKLEVVK